MAKHFNIFLVVFLIFALLFSIVGSELLYHYDISHIKETGFKAHSVNDSEIRQNLNEKVNEYNKENDRIESDSVVISEVRTETEKAEARRIEEERRQEELLRQQEILRQKEEERERERLRHEALLREQEEARLKEEERLSEIARQEALLREQEEALAEEERQAEIAKMEALLKEQEEARLKEEERLSEIARQEELVRQKEAEEALEKERHDALLREQEEERQASLLKEEEEARKAQEAKALREQEENEFAREQVSSEETSDENNREESVVEETFSENTQKTEEALNDTQSEELNQNEEINAEMQEPQSLAESTTPKTVVEPIEETVAVKPRLRLADKLTEERLYAFINSIDTNSDIPSRYNSDQRGLSSITNNEMQLSHSAIKDSVMDSLNKFIAEPISRVASVIKNAVDIKAEFVSLSSLMWYITVGKDVETIRYAFNDDPWKELKNTTNGVFAIPYTIDKDNIKLSVQIFENGVWSNSYVKEITKKDLDKASSNAENTLKSYENVLTNLGKDITLVQLPNAEI